MDMEFIKMLPIGKRGEAKVKAALVKRGNAIDDVSEQASYQKKDIDFIVSRSGKSVTLEVKNDVRSNYTGNVFVELWNANNIKRCGEGWVKYCEADYIAFVQEDYSRAHIVERGELIKNCWSDLYKQNRSPFSIGYIVPIEKLQEYSSYFCLKLGE